jgi:hypothetical protein
MNQLPNNTLVIIYFSNNSTVLTALYTIRRYEALYGKIDFRYEIKEGEYYV